MRFYLILKKNKMYIGIDIAVLYGVSVLAAVDGDVILVGWVFGYGKIVIIDNGSGILILYVYFFLINVLVG